MLCMYVHDSYTNCCSPFKQNCVHEQGIDKSDSAAYKIVFAKITKGDYVMSEKKQQHIISPTKILHVCSAHLRKRGSFHYHVVEWYSLRYQWLCGCAVNIGEIYCRTLDFLHKLYAYNTTIISLTAIFPYCLALTLTTLWELFTTQSAKIFSGAQCFLYLF